MISEVAVIFNIISMVVGMEARKSWAVSLVMADRDTGCRACSVFLGECENLLNEFFFLAMQH